jgi:hypothetical protein
MLSRAMIHYEFVLTSVFLLELNCDYARPHLFNQAIPRGGIAPMWASPGFRDGSLVRIAARRWRKS